MKRAVFGIGLAVFMFVGVSSANAFILDFKELYESSKSYTAAAAGAFTLDFSGLNFFSNPTDSFNYFGRFWYR